MKKIIGFALFGIVVGVAAGMIVSTNHHVSTTAAETIGLGSWVVCFFALLISDL